MGLNFFGGWVFLVGGFLWFWWVSVVLVGVCKKCFSAKIGTNNYKQDNKFVEFFGFLAF